MAYIEFKNIVKEYKMGEVTIKALNNTNFEIEKGTKNVTKNKKYKKKKKKTKKKKKKKCGVHRYAF